LEVFYHIPDSLLAQCSAVLLGPLPSELIYDPQFDELVAGIGKHPAMYVVPPTFAAVLGYLDGFSRGRGGAPLLGLREWLVLRAGGWNNLNWTGLACREITGDHDERLACGDDPQLIAALAGLLQEFLDYRRANGLSKVFWEYAEWVRRQDWYSGPLPTVSGLGTE
jgi:hypothetical protein